MQVASVGGRVGVWHAPSRLLYGARSRHHVDSHLPAWRHAVDVAAKAAVGNAGNAYLIADVTRPKRAQEAQNFRVAYVEKFLATAPTRQIVSDVPAAVFVSLIDFDSLRNHFDRGYLQFRFATVGAVFVLAQQL